MKKLLNMLMILLLLAPATAMAASIEDLQLQIKELSEQIDEMDNRVGVNERHTATDRISFYGDLRVKADSTSQKVYFSQPGMNYHFTEDNNILYTTRLRLKMKAKVADNISFTGRLSMYKNWGDSTGVKVMDSWNAFTMDGTNGGNTTGDNVRVERAFFVWKDIADSSFYLSVGRRPSTYGAPTNYRENEQRGGTPSGHVVNFDFDGLTIGYHLSDRTDVEGQTLRFCYGQGYESQYGNGTLYTQTDVEDTHLGGFNFDVWNTDASWLQMTLFGVKDVSDGFKGLAVMPMDINNGTNPLGYVSRLQASTNIGDMLLGGVGGGITLENDMNFFTSVGFTRTIANDNFNSMGFGGLLSDAVPMYDASGNPTGYFKNGVGENHNGYSMYVGMQIPAPLGKFGLEYNYGSKFWIPFTQAQDDVLGSKLATRGHVGEAYYIFDITPKAFIKVGYLYYDYSYTGSGSPVGMPQNVDSIKNGTAFSAFPAVDTAWDANLSMTVKF